MSRLWEKGEAVDDLILRFTVGQDHLLDGRLVEYDVRASKAHARMLASNGYLKQEECELLCSTLDELGAEHVNGDWSISIEEEDCHTALELRLIERLGPLGGRIHLGRSRNDQVLAALRLYLRDSVRDLCDLAGQVVQGLEGLVQDQGTTPLPGYTHLQRAMPSSVGAWAGAFASEIKDDIGGLERCLQRVNKNPLGSAAGYGVPVVVVVSAMGKPPTSSGLTRPTNLSPPCRSPGARRKPPSFLK